MRLIEAIRNFNVDLKTIASFLSSKGMPLENWNPNTCLKDKQCSLLYREFDYKSQVKFNRSFYKQEKPEVQAVLDEIHKKHSKKIKNQTPQKTKAEKKAERKRLIEEELRHIKGQKVKLKIKGFSNKVLYTKGYGNLFVEGRVQLSDVKYNGNELNRYWAERLLKTLNVKTEFVVVDPQVNIEGNNTTYARLRYDVNPEQSWLIQYKQLKIGTEFNGTVIDVDEEHYIVKSTLNFNYFIWGYVNKDEYVSNYDVNSSIRACIKSTAADLFSPFIFTSKEQLQEIEESSTNTKSESKNNPSTDDNDFIKWRESQKKELDIQREQLRAAVYGNSQSNSFKHNSIEANFRSDMGLDDTHIQSHEPAEAISCEANFFEDYKIKGQTLDKFLYNNKAVPFDKHLLSTGTIVLRYKLLIALSDLISAYHRANLILGDIDPANFEIISDEPIIIKMLDDSGTSYKTNMIHSSGNMHFVAPEVKNHLSPVTPMSECYSFASLVYLMLTGEEFRITNDLSKAVFITPFVMDMLCLSLVQDPMLRPKMENWCDALRFGIDELSFCPQCHQWYIPSSTCCCNLCEKKSYLGISLKIGNYGEAEIYNVEQNDMEIKPTLIGNAKGNVIITESTSKLLYGYHFGLSVKKDLPFAVITITQCNSNNDITLNIIPMSKTVFTLLNEDYSSKDNPFYDTMNIEIKGDKLYRTTFLVESDLFKKKIVKLCHI